MHKYQETQTSILKGNDKNKLNHKELSKRYEKKNYFIGLSIFAYSKILNFILT